MSEAIGAVFEAAMGLSAAERAELAARLLESLDPAGDAGWEAAWAEEIAHRLAELNAGNVVPIPWSEARAMIVQEGDGAAAPRD